MHALEHKMALNRLSGKLLLAVAVLVALSWGITRVRSSAQAPVLVEIASAGTFERTGATTDSTIASLQARLQSEPDDWAAYSQLGLAYLQKARETGDPAYYPKAEGVLREALKRQPDDYAATAGMGALALARHDFRTALDWGQTAVRINPYRSYGYGVVADAQAELGRYDEAERTLQTMVDQRPDPSAYTRISYLRELHGDVAGALQMMQWAVDGSQPTGENGAWTRTQLANLHFNRGDLQQAELEYRRILDGWPDYAYALAGLGHVRAAQGRSDEAIQLLTQASQIAPLPEFVIALGDLYRVKGDSAAAEQQYALVRAIQQLFRANDVDIDMEMALFDADHAGDHGADAAAVVAQARQAFAARPSIHAADALAWALYRAGAYREAQEYAAQALMLGTKDALKLYHAGMIAYRLDLRAEARAYLERALAINPDFSILYAAAASRTLQELR